MKRKTIWTILEIILAILLVFLVLSSTKAQMYFSDITEKQYNKIMSGNAFYEGQVQLTDGSWHKGWIARFPNSNRLRFRSVEDSMHVHLLTDKYVNSFCYTLEDTFPRFVFKEMPFLNKKTDKIAIEAITLGDINMYVYRTVQKTKFYNHFFQKKEEHLMTTEFFLEKDGKLYDVNNLEREVGLLIKDKKEVFDFYKKTKKIRDSDDYRAYINTIIYYNETE